MACKKCGSNKSTSCACTDTSYTIPSDCTYGDSSCNLPTEPCESVTCTECVRHCHKEDKWCTELLLADFGGPDGVGSGGFPVEFCVSNGERLDQILQKLTLAQTDPSAYPFKVKNFYTDNIGGGAFPAITFIWFEFLESLTNMTLWYAPDDSNDWEMITQFNSLINPLLANTFTVDSNMISLIPGNVYKFKLVTTNADGIVYDPGSVILYVTIPE
jgi:hypothetical protein